MFRIYMAELYYNECSKLFEKYLTDAKNNVFTNDELDKELIEIAKKNEIFKSFYSDAFPRRLNELKTTGRDPNNPESTENIIFFTTATGFGTITTPDIFLPEMFGTKFGDYITGMNDLLDEYYGEKNFEGDETVIYFRLSTVLSKFPCNAGGGNFKKRIMYFILSRILMNFLNKQLLLSYITYKMARICCYVFNCLTILSVSKRMRNAAYDKIMNVPNTVINAPKTIINAPKTIINAAKTGKQAVQKTATFFNTALTRVIKSKQEGQDVSLPNKEVETEDEDEDVSLPNKAVEVEDEDEDEDEDKDKEKEININTTKFKSRASKAFLAQNLFVIIELLNINCVSVLDCKYAKKSQVKDTTERDADYLFNVGKVLGGATIALAIGASIAASGGTALPVYLTAFMSAFGSGVATQTLLPSDSIKQGIINGEYIKNAKPSIFNFYNTNLNKLTIESIQTNKCDTTDKQNRIISEIETDMNTMNKLIYDGYDQQLIYYKYYMSVYEMLCNNKIVDPVPRGGNKKTHKRGGKGSKKTHKRGGKGKTHKRGGKGKKRHTRR